MTAKARYKRRPEASAGRTKLGRIVVISAAGMILLTGMLFFASVICLKKDASGWLLTLSAYLCCAFSAFPVGCFAAKSVGKSGLISGLLSSIPLCILLMILCLVLYGSLGSGFLIGSVLILFFGALGGIVILNLRNKRRYK